MSVIESPVLAAVISSGAAILAAYIMRPRAGCFFGAGTSAGQPPEISPEVERTNPPPGWSTQLIQDNLDGANRLVTISLSAISVGLLADWWGRRSGEFGWVFLGWLAMGFGPIPLILSCIQLGWIFPANAHPHSRRAFYRWLISFLIAIPLLIWLWVLTVTTKPPT